MRDYRIIVESPEIQSSVGNVRFFGNMINAYIDNGFTITLKKKENSESSLTGWEDLIFEIVEKPVEELTDEQLVELAYVSSLETATETFNEAQKKNQI